MFSRCTYLSTPNTHYSINGQYLTIHSLPANVSTITITAIAGTKRVTYIVNVFSGVRCHMLQRPSASVEPIENKTEIRLYPNPAKDVITLDLGTEAIDKGEAKILDTQGKELYSVELKEKITQFSVSHLSAGLYFVQITNQNKRKVFKIVIQ